MTIIYVAGLGQHVAIEHDRVIDVDPNRDALVERVGETTASSADIDIFQDLPQSPADPSICVTEILHPVTDEDSNEAYYLDNLYHTGDENDNNCD
jgi:hypothetical protein